ncbi:hypothetical protein [Klebsiella pneumoniae]|uniref:hypothetical protein n=1 Tax=Klebsiella pneumoniae TaxID=573 RepID=UPI001E4AF57B|nr:hypothetical protein [Klebsiella pneumoniae]
MMILRGLLMALELYATSATRNDRRGTRKNRLTLRWLREELCSTAELVARGAGDCGGAAGLPLPRQPGAKGLLVRTKYPVDGPSVSV